MEAQNTAEGTGSAQERRLSQEAARWRVRFREAERTIAMLRNHIADLEARLHASSPAAELIVAELNTLRRTVAELQEKQESAEIRARDAERRARGKTIQAALTALVADSRLTDAAAAKVVLEQHCVVADDDVVVFLVRDAAGEQTVPATLDNAGEHGLLSSIFFKNGRKRTAARRTTTSLRASQERSV
jgi:predicted RNase H-like nuclease (RuvC/YqgF family)